MSLRLSSRRICLGVASVALFALWVYSAQGADKHHGRSIEFSEPKSDEVTTNLHQLTSKKDGLKQLEEDLYKPLQSFAPKSSLEGVVAPLPTPQRASVIQNKRVKELLERRKNWIFMSPEDLMSGPTVEEILQSPQYGADGQEKRDVAPMERYYQRLMAKRAGGQSPSQAKDEVLFGSSKKYSPHDEVAASDDSNLPKGIRESAESLNQFFEPNSSDSPFARGAAHGTLSDTFGLGNNPLSKEQVQEHKKFMDEYHTVVDPSWRPPPVATPDNPFADPVAAARPAAGLGGSSIPAVHKRFDAQLDAAYPQLGPAPLPDVNALALGQSRPAAALPQAQPTQTGPAAPTFAAPKRPFY